MIKVVIERHAKSGVNVLPMLKDLRMAVMPYAGYLGAETLVNTEDRSIVVVISSWESIKDWNAWAASEERVKLYAKMESLLVEPPKVSTYRHLSYQQAVNVDVAKVSF